MDDVADHCGASTGCGGCSELVAEIVHGEHRRLKVLKSDVAPSHSAAAHLPALEFA